MGGGGANGDFVGVFLTYGEYGFSSMRSWSYFGKGYEI